MFPNLIAAWGVYEQNALRVVREKMMCCMSWRWLGEKEIGVLALPDFPEDYARDPFSNKKLVRHLHGLYMEADTIMGHNVIEFDNKVAKTEFLKAGLKPTPPHRFIDTLKIARSQFRMNFNKLGEIGKLLGLGQKVETGGYSLWERCMAGDMKAWEIMRRYNIGDIRLLEAVYFKLRPWAPNHPDMNARDQHHGCPVCRGTDLERRGFGLNKHGTYIRYACRSCGKWCSGDVVREQMRYR